MGYLHENIAHFYFKSQHITSIWLFNCKVPLAHRGQQQCQAVSLESIQS